MAQLSTLLGLALLATVAPWCQSYINVKRIPSMECHKCTGSIFEYSATDIWQTTEIQLSDFQNKQEPGANATEILNGIKYVRPGNYYEPNFPMFSKIEVNGDNQHPLYAFLKSCCPTTRDGFADKDYLFWEPIMNSDIRWNFEKFLIDYSGRPVRRYDPSTIPHKLIEDIEDLLYYNGDYPNPIIEYPYG